MGLISLTVLGPNNVFRWRWNWQRYDLTLSLWSIYTHTSVRLWKPYKGIIFCLMLAKVSYKTDVKFTQKLLDWAPLISANTNSVYKHKISSQKLKREVYFLNRTFACPLALCNRIFLKVLWDCTVNTKNSSECQSRLLSFQLKLFWYLSLLVGPNTFVELIFCVL